MAASGVGSVRQRRAKTHCVLCGERMPAVCKREVDLVACVLCGYAEGQSLCRRCRIPWSPVWMQVQSLQLQSLRPHTFALLTKESGDSVVCLQCVSEEEYGLRVREQLSDKILEQLVAVERRAEEQGGFPAIELVNCSVVCLTLNQDEGHVQRGDLVSPVGTLVDENHILQSPPICGDSAGNYCTQASPLQSAYGSMPDASLSTSTEMEIYPDA